MGFMFVKSCDIKEKKEQKRGINFMGMLSAWGIINVPTGSQIKLNTHTNCGRGFFKAL